MKVAIGLTIFVIVFPLGGVIADHIAAKPTCENHVELSIQGDYVEYRVCNGYYGFTHTETPLRNLDTGTEYAK